MEVTKSIHIGQMTSHEDLNKINYILHGVWGVRNVEVNLDNNEAVISFNDDSASLQDFEQALIDGGFQIYKH